MKKIIIASLGSIMSFTVFAGERIPAPNSFGNSFYLPPPPAIPPLIIHPANPNPIAQKNNQNLQKFSLKAQELIIDYRPRNTNLGVIDTPPINEKKHINEEYRPAWEELFYWNITNNLQVSISGGYKNYPGIALCELGSTNSIPMLVNAYKELLQINECYMVHNQTILIILLHIDATESLDAFFALLDTTDAQFGVKNYYQEWIRPELCEMLFIVLKNPNALILSDPQKRIKHSTQLQQNFLKYRNNQLSAPNQAFLEKARKKEPQP